MKKLKKSTKIGCGVGEDEDEPRKWEQSCLEEELTFMKRKHMGFEGEKKQMEEEDDCEF